MMIKNAEQMLVAAEVMKIAQDLQRSKYASDFGAASPGQEQNRTWYVENSLPTFVNQAYRNLQAISAQLDAIIGQDTSAASMRMIDGIVNKPAPTA